MIVYIVQNFFNGKIYVGKTESTLEKRWSRHLASAKLDSQYAIHRAIRKYGAASFLICPLSSATSPEELAQLEISYIAKFHSTEKGHGYNMTIGGEPGWAYVNQRNKVAHPKGMLNKKHSVQTKNRMRKSHEGLMSGKKHPLYGKKHTAASKAKTAESVRLARKNKFWSTKKLT